MKNWKTTVSASLAAFLALAAHSGVTVGHIGSTDFVAVGAAIAAIFAGCYAKDASSAQ